MKIIYVLKEIKWGIPFLKRVNVRTLLFLITFFTLSHGRLLSQEMPNEMWHPGYVVLDKGDSVFGNLKYDFLTNILQVAISKNQIKAFSSHQILNFKFNCQFFKRPRIVYALPYNQNGNVKNMIFFEILAEGPITLMCREYIVNEALRNYNPMYSNNNLGMSNNRRYLTYDYFFLTSEGEIVKFENRKKEVLPFFKPFKREVESFIKENKLRVDRQADLVKITSFYNQLAKE